MSGSKSTHPVRSAIEGFPASTNEDSPLLGPAARQRLTSGAEDCADHTGKAVQEMMKEFRDPLPLDGLDLTKCEVSQAEAVPGYDLEQIQDPVAGVGEKPCCGKPVPDHPGIKVSDGGTNYCF